MPPPPKRKENRLKNRDIYTGALKILSERVEIGTSEDYEERAPYLIAAFCCECAEADRVYRRARSLPAAKAVNDVYVDLSADFACSSRFSTAACMYLASMLVIDEDPELSDKLFDKYSDIMSAICAELPAQIEAISNKYVY